jgi:hypothetical protein
MKWHQVGRQTPQMPIQNWNLAGLGLLMKMIIMMIVIMMNTLVMMR